MVQNYPMWIVKFFIIHMLQSFISFSSIKTNCLWSKIADQIYVILQLLVLFCKNFCSGKIGGILKVALKLKGLWKNRFQNMYRVHLHNCKEAHSDPYDETKRKKRSVRDSLIAPLPEYPCPLALCIIWLSAEMYIIAFCNFKTNWSHGWTEGTLLFKKNQLQHHKILAWVSTKYCIPKV